MPAAKKTIHLDRYELADLVSFLDSLGNYSFKVEATIRDYDGVVLGRVSYHEDTESPVFYPA